jgi:hypothetical protein
MTVFWVVSCRLILYLIPCTRIDSESTFLRGRYYSHRKLAQKTGSNRIVHPTTTTANSEWVAACFATYSELHIAPFRMLGEEVWATACPFGAFRSLTLPSATFWARGDKVPTAEIHCGALRNLLLAAGSAREAHGDLLGGAGCWGRR